jgi:hypothetical protein
MHAVLVNRSAETPTVGRIDGVPIIHALTQLPDLLDQRLEAGA